MKRGYLAAALLSALALAGGGVALAVGEATGTVSVCATVPAQTIAVNGSPVSTVPEATACATTTYTVPTVTIATTTATAPTFASSTAYTSSPPAFTPTREIDVTTATALKSALANLQSGDLVKATAPFTVTGETTLNKVLSGHAELDLHGVSFVYNGGSNLPAVFLNGASGLYVYGGDLSTADTGGTCLLFHGGSRILWWGFSVHDCGGSGVGVFNTTAIDHLDLEGSITKVGQNLAWDPHAEKGTGEHGAILWDAGNTTTFTNNRFAFDEHDIPVGACVEIGNSTTGPATGNVLILRCINETERALQQAGGSALEVWGATSTLGLDVKYLEGSNLQGRALDGSDASQTLSGVAVDYGRATNTNLNTSLNEPSPTLPWYPRTGPIYHDVLPTP